VDWLGVADELDAAELLGWIKWHGQQPDVTAALKELTKQIEKWRRGT
jgi:hypothetical protein